MRFDPTPRFGPSRRLLPDRMAVVSHSHPSLSKGGAEIAAYSLFKGLRQVGVDAIYVGACNMADRHKLSFADENEFATFYEGERYDHFYHVAPKGVEAQLVAILREQGIGLVNFHHFFNLGLNALRAAMAERYLAFFASMLAVSSPLPFLP